ncbi:MAG: hypothetical protein ACRD72_21350 [Candidatus Angelobacter sp.]
MVDVDFYEEKIDPELLQARWVLGGIRSDDLPDLAVSALQQGLDGTALRQLAGLVRPTLADLEDLPQRAFIDMGLTLMSRDHAVDVLMERGIPLANPILSTLLKVFSRLHASMEGASCLLGRRNLRSLYRHGGACTFRCGRPL